MNHKNSINNMDNMKYKNSVNHALLERLVGCPLVVCFFGLCFAALFSYLIKEDTIFSDMENRYLTVCPKISIEGLASGSFMESFESYCNEQVPLRSILVKGKALLEQAQLKCENDGVSKGDDGYLFTKVMQESAQLDKNISAISLFAENMEEKGRETYIAIAPTSAYVNFQKLPMGMPVLDENACIERMQQLDIFCTENSAGNEAAAEKEITKEKEALTGNEAVTGKEITIEKEITEANEALTGYETVAGKEIPSDKENLDDSGYEKKVHFVDLSAVLKEHADEYLYYKTDHHWTSLGAQYAYEEIIGKMGAEAKDITRYEKHERCDFYGTNYAKFKGAGAGPDTITYYDVPIYELRLKNMVVNTLYDVEKLETYDKYAMFMYGNDGKYEVVSDKNHTGEADLIIVKNSYANCLIPYLTMNFDDIIVVDLRYFGGSVTDIIDENKDAKILLMYDWSFINEDNHFYKLVK